MKDCLEHEVNGVKTPTGDAQAMTRACLNLLDNPGFASGLSRNAIETAKHFTWEWVADETLAFYESLLRTKSNDS
jgi:glycosyltransferase involved in cell wall biosynthesis